MSHDIEFALSGDYGEEAQRAAEAAVKQAVDQIAKIVGADLANLDFSKSSTFGGVPKGGAFTPPSPMPVIVASSGEAVMPKPR